MTTVKKQLDEEARNLITLALRLARDQFQKDAKLARDEFQAKYDGNLHDGAGYLRVATQFEQQAALAQTLHDEFDIADQITLERDRTFPS